ncbi:MAG: carboxymuconolactone decarboxylase family protein [candidate division WOR-3 bacterium]|nr:MAG: carboxymuconolactone decarboxylase family protein [candidate division WOR-3 bacterium]
MSKRTIEDFIREREELIENMSRYCGQDAKRFFHLDSQVYKDGALSAKIKELLGLVASLVLRCDDCINYHLVNCHENGISDEELAEALTVGLIAGGSITIPHLRRAYGSWDELKKGGKA